MSRATSRHLETVSTRRAEPKDLRFIQELSAGVFLAYGSYDHYLNEWFQDERVSTYIACVNARPAGFAMLAIFPDPNRPRERVGDLLAIAVRPEAQSRGIGRRLVEECLRRAREHSPPTREVRLSVAEGNAKAQRLFARHGFRFSEGVGIYPSGQRALLMVKRWDGEEEDEA